MIKKRNIAQEIITGLQELKAGGGKKTTIPMPSGVRRVRAKTGLSQAEFAACLNISVRTLQEWEQERTKPTGPALSLLQLVEQYPELLTRNKKPDPDQRDTA